MDSAEMADAYDAYSYLFHAKIISRMSCLSNNKRGAWCAKSSAPDARRSTLHAQARRFPCNPKMIMSYYTNLRMSYSEDAIILYFQGGSYGRRGHGYHESGGIEAVTCNSQGNR
jgi:hypothetical protein